MTRGSRLVLLMLIVLLFGVLLGPLLGCGRRTVALASDEADSGPSNTENPDASSASPPQPQSQPTRASCMRINPLKTALPSDGARNIDVLLVIDDSSSMAEAQAALRLQMSNLIDDLTLIDDDSPTKIVRVMRSAVVSSDLGTPGVSGVAGCSEHGDDGVLKQGADPMFEECRAAYPKFLEFAAPTSTATADDLGCLASLGTDGCRFTQPLEAGLKALWPASDQRVNFIAGLDGSGTLGHGEDTSLGFLHGNDPTERSVLLVLVVSNHDDCSAQDPSLFRPSASLDPDLPGDAALLAQGLDVRCNANPDQLFDTMRYVSGLRALRPGAEQLVVFAAIVGVPPQLLRTPVNLDDAAARNDLFTRIRTDPAMSPRLDDHGTLDPSDDSLQPSCTGQAGPAFPPRRIVEAAAAFAQNGIVESICDGALARAIPAIVERVRKHVGGTCLPAPLTRTQDRRVDCDLYWEIANPSRVSGEATTACAQMQFPFLLPPNDGKPAMSSSGALHCRVPQLAVEARDGALTPIATRTDGQLFADGWFYDDFSHDVQSSCPDRPRRIAFTATASPPSGITMTLECMGTLLNCE